MATCFVIQPFDRAKFDKRYKETFRPAIEAAGLEPYRVDEDPGAAIPIREIERGIRQSEICFAEISTDNPNVWFELGFAIASRKPVVMVCTADRDRFPFDVQHRAIVSYKSESASDFAELAKRITARLTAEVERQHELEDISDFSPVADSAGLSTHETAALAIVGSYAAVPADSASHWMIKQDMNRAGYTDIAVTLAVRSLLKKGLVTETEAQNESGDSYAAIDVTDLGLEWIEANQDQLTLRKEAKKQASEKGLAPPDLGQPDDDLPF